jgi:hypothetical protein
MLSGSVAMSIYVLPRATRDFDFVVDLQGKDIPSLIQHFNKGYYCDEDAVPEAVKNKSIFKIIDHNSGYKADFVVLKNETFRITEFNRRTQADFFGTSVYIVSAEDLLLSKLIWIQELQSAVQKEDIRNLAAVSMLDKTYINFWIDKLNLNTFGLINSD